MLREEVRILTPTGMLGYGFPVQWLKKGLDMNPDAITVDAGSTDSGPQKLGLGLMTCSYEAYYKEMEILIEASREKKIPLIISSAGGDGTNQHVDLFVDIVNKISKQKNYKLKTASIYSDMDKNYIKGALRSGKIKPLGPVEPLTEKEIDLSTVIVGQMGVEPYNNLMGEDNDIDVIIAGRSYDPAPTALIGLRRGFDPGLCWHMGKIMECGALCAEPVGKSIFGTLREDFFTLEALNPIEKCKTYSVAAHTLYEKSHPYLLPGPDGVLDLKNCKFEQINDRSVKVSGSRLKKTDPPTIKLEGASVVGERAICISGIRDPFMIKQINPVLEEVRNEVKLVFPECDYELIYHIYGKDGTMGENEPVKDFIPLEICVIIEVTALDQKKAISICNKARTTLLHQPYEGRIATAGNIALPFTPLEIPLGKVCRFNVYHLMEVENYESLFPFKVEIF